MKRPDRTRQHIIARLVRRRWTKRLRRVGRVRLIIEVPVVPPDVLSFRRNFEATVRFLDEFRDRIMARKRFREIVHVDLVPVKEISVPVAIVLAAEFHRWVLIHHLRLNVRSSERWSPQVKNLLSDLGVFDLLGVRPPISNGADDNLTLTKLQSGHKFDGKKIDALQTAFREIVEGFMNNPELYDGLSEAVENAITHAYPADYEPRHQWAGHRWWGAGCLDPQTMNLRFFIFDQGAGIPYTLPANDWYEALRERLAVLTQGALANDALMLRAALELGRSSTGEAHRGRGLKKMSDVIDDTQGAFLRIISGSGEIICHPGGRVETFNRPTNIGGTLIEWNMPATALIDDQQEGSEP